MIWVAPLTVKEPAAVPPKLTAVAPLRFVPVIVTLVPPAAGPVFGLTLVIVGGETCACPSLGKPRDRSTAKMAPATSGHRCPRILVFRRAKADIPRWRSTKNSPPDAD